MLRIPGQKEFAVSKKLYYLAPALEHGRTQLLSQRQKRYEELEPRLGMSKPEKAPAPAKAEEDEE